MADDPQKAIRQGLRDAGFKGFHIMVFMAIYEQFFKACASPYVVVHADCFFRVDVGAIVKRLKVSEPKVQERLRQVVEAGYLEKRKTKSGMQYRITWNKLAPFIEATRV